MHCEELNCPVCRAHQTRKAQGLSEEVHVVFDAGVMEVVDGDGFPRAAA